MINITQLRTLVAVVRHSSFAEAARELGYSPSAVSQQISAFEKTFKVELFERRAHSVYPTPAAREIEECATIVLTALDDLRNRMRTLSQGWHGSIRVGTFGTANLHLLPEAVRVFSRRFPLSEVLVQEERPMELLRALVARDLDVALLYAHGSAPPVLPDQLMAVELLQEDILLLLPERHRLARATQVSIADLQDETWIASHEGTPGAMELAKLTSAAGILPRIKVRSNDPGVIQGLVRGSLGIALLPAQACMPMTGIKTVVLTDANAVRCVYVAYAADAVNSLIPPYIAALRASASALVERDPLHMRSTETVLSAEVRA